MGLEAELTDEAIVGPATDGSVLEIRWEAIRQHFLADPRSVGELAAVARINWPGPRWEDGVAKYAKLSWSHLLAMKFFGIKKARMILEILEDDTRRMDSAG